MNDGPIGIVSLELDLHAHAVGQRLRERFGINTHIFAIDDYCATGRLSTGLLEPAVVTDYTGVEVPIADIRVVWWRRVNQPQKPAPHLDEETHAFVSAEWKHAFNTAWANEFTGIWVNDPRADAAASAKTVQLKAAKQAGLNVPDTLISNDPKKIRSFFDKHGGEIVAKKLVGVSGKAFATVLLTSKMLRDEELVLCPCVYQRRIFAKLHLRVIALGPRIRTFAFKSDDLDWRRDLNFRAARVELGQDAEKKIISLLASMGLMMGILDIILDVHEVLHFLEINPQGQFLFLEKLANDDVTEFCAEFFRDLWTQGTR